MALISERQAAAVTYVLHLGSRSSRYSHGVRAYSWHRLQRGQFWPLTALCIGFLLAGRPSFADDLASGKLPVDPLVQEDQESEALLLRVEQQISSGHFVWPQDDNALQTWQLFLKSASPTAPRTRRALTDFVGLMSRRATEEQREGQPEISRLLVTFETIANALLDARAPPPTANAQAANSSPIPESDGSRGSAASPSELPTRDTSPTAAGSIPATSRASTDPANGDAGKAETRLPDAEGSPRGATPIANMADTTGASLPVGTTGNTALALAASVGHSAANPPDAQQQAMAAMYVSRGNEMLASKDISAARKFYLYAANGGSAAAAMALARTFDPAYLAELGVVGLRPDLTLAEAWYRKAVVLGDPDAKARLQALGFNYAN